MRLIPHHYHSRRKRAAGVTLVELLTVIMILGILSSIAIPTMSQIRKRSMISQAKRNAQHASSVFAAAKAAGAKFQASNVGAFIEELDSGVFGPLTQSQYKLSGLNKGPVAEAEFDPKTYLSYDAGNDVLVYLGTEN
jgi:prepilin-type N-terminal cleavage/methylation domain-containing protein